MTSVTSDDLNPVNSTLKIFVLSDLHATGDSKPRDQQESWFTTSPQPGAVGEDPLAALLQLIDRLELQADFVLCAGDMCNKANATGLAYAWRALNDISKALGAQLIATAGNHDVDSRFVTTDHDPRGALYELSPPFPVPSYPHLSDRYWSRNFAIVSTPRCRIVTLNSCAFHGYGETVKEYEHGRMSKATAERLSRELAAVSVRPPLNILLVHHHPARLPRVDLDDYSEMILGQVLIDTLANDGPWLIVHGHKHVPWLRNAQGGSDSPVIFSAGSFGAVIHPEAAAGYSRNQVYLLEFPGTNVATELQLDLVGRFTAWDWTFGKGWDVARVGSGLPAGGGFGWRQPLGTIAADLAQQVMASDGPFTWNDALKHQPRLAYLLPEDLDTLKSRLAYRNPPVHLEFRDDGTVVHFAKSEKR